jgi:hypothetical protein
MVIPYTGKWRSSLRELPLFCEQEIRDVEEHKRQMGAKWEPNHELIYKGYLRMVILQIRIRKPKKR